MPLHVNIIDVSGCQTTKSLWQADSKKLCSSVLLTLGHYYHVMYASNLSIDLLS